MKPTMGCGHTEYDRGHCGVVGCANDCFSCPDCCPSTQLRSWLPAGGWADRDKHQAADTS